VTRVAPTALIPRFIRLRDAPRYLAWTKIASIAKCGRTSPVFELARKASPLTVLTWTCGPEPNRKGGCATGFGKCWEVLGKRLSGFGLQHTLLMLLATARGCLTLVDRFTTMNLQRGCVPNAIRARSRPSVPGSRFVLRSPLMKASTGSSLTPCPETRVQIRRGPERSAHREMGRCSTNSARSRAHLRVLSAQN
jgi:hypothetical protein